MESYSDVLILNHGGARACKGRGLGRDGGTHGEEQDLYVERPLVYGEGKLQTKQKVPMVRNNIKKISPL